jgi:MraZ protein
VGTSGILWDNDMMFRGVSSIKIDEKGRVSIPSKYRSGLNAEGAASVVVTIDTDSPCLLLYPSLIWEDIERKLQALPSFDKAARRIQRLLIGHATDLEMDNSGRILLPPLLREYAGLDHMAMLVGQGNKFEIWSELNWQQGRAQWLEMSQGEQADLPDEVRSISL